MEDEVIVRVDGEGGALTLHGQRNGRGWRFSLNLFDQTMSWVDDGPVTERTSEVVETWSKALRLLDEYPWHRLYPLTVHPEFRNKVLKAVVSRNKRDHDEYGADRWNEVCSLPKLDELKIEMNFQEIQIPKFESTQGQLLAANPAFSKPSNITKVQWALLLLQQVRSEDMGGNNSVLAVPRSFWPLSTEELHEYAKSEGVECVDLIDEWNGPRDYEFTTPVDSIRQVLDHLQRGKNVIILSNTTNISDFVRALLHLVFIPYFSHPAKVWCGIAQGGEVELTQFQRGYIYGLMNANGSFGLEQLRNARRAGSSI